MTGQLTDRVLVGFWSWYDELTEAARPDHRAADEQAAGVPAAPFVRAGHRRQPIHGGHGRACSMAGSVWCVCPRTRSATRPRGCSARSSSRARGRPPPAAPASRNANAATPRLVIDECHNFLNLPYPDGGHARRGPRLPAVDDARAPVPRASCHANCGKASPPTPAARSSSPLSRRTPASWPATPYHSSPNTTSPTSASTTPPHAWSYTAKKLPRSPCAPKRSHPRSPAGARHPTRLTRHRNPAARAGRRAHLPDRHNAQTTRQHNQTRTGGPPHQR